MRGSFWAKNSSFLKTVDTKTERLTRSNLRGVWGALITPWTEDFTLREDRLAEEVTRYARDGLHGVYTGGTTGEFYAQSDVTYARITEVVCRTAMAEKISTQIGCTALSNITTAERIRIAVDSGADALQLALPFWLELKDDEVMSFFRACVRAADDLPIVFYNTERAKRRIGPSLLGRLTREFPTLIGMKDTGCSPEELREMLDETGGFSIFGGEDSLWTHMPHGGMGCYSSLCGLKASLLLDLYELCLQREWEKAKPLHQSVMNLLTAVGPMIDNGLLDSALDRAFRILGGSDVGLECAGPYRSFTAAQLDQLHKAIQSLCPEWLVR